MTPLVRSSQSALKRGRCLRSRRHLALFVRRAECATSASEQRFARRDGHQQALGHLSDGAIIDVAQHHGCALTVGQGVQRVHDRIRIRAGGIGCAGVIVLDCSLPTPSLALRAAPMVDQSLSSDIDQPPAADLIETVNRRCPSDFVEHFGGDVFGDGPTPASSVNESEDGVGVANEQGLECKLTSCQRLCVHTNRSSRTAAGCRVDKKFRRGATGGDATRRSCSHTTEGESK